VTLPFSLPPIVERELRVASRRSITYWGRTGAAASGLFIVWVLTAQMRFTGVAAAGQFLFRLLAGIAAFAVIASVLRLSSVAFAREKREDTLGLLFLTPLRPVEIVLGKLLSSSLPAFYEFIAVVPLLSIPMLMGGVTVVDFALLVLALANWVFLGATLGLYVSARSWDEKRASAGASALMMCVVVLFPGLAFAGAFAAAGPGAIALLALSPAFSICQAVFPKMFGATPLWASLLWTHFLGWMFFVAACRTLPRCWQNRPANTAPRGEHLGAAAAPSVPTASPKPARRFIGRAIEAAERARLFTRNPIIWMALRWRPPASGVWVIALIGVIGCIPGIVLGLSGAGWGHFFHPAFALFVFYWINLSFKTFAATQASYAFARDRPENPLELLLCTSVTPRELLDGFRIGLRDALQPWLMRALWIEVAWLAVTLALHVRDGAEDIVQYVLASIAVVGFLVPDVRAVTWAGLWRSVIAKGAREADKEAFGEVLAFPWIPAGLAWVAATAAFSHGEQAITVFLIAWIFFSAITNWWRSRAARGKLETRLALWAQRRASGEFEHYDGWRRLGRRLGQWRRGQRSSR
jgi:hypothetical protein